MAHHVYKLVRETKTKVLNISASLILVAMSLGGALPAFITNTAHAAGTINISSESDLCNAIEHQADGDVWNIQAGTYALPVCNDIEAEGQTGWYFPITANDLTINGVGNPTIYGTGYTTNGAWATQNFVTIFGNNVTINGLTLMPKVEPNKTIEVLGSNATIENVTIEPNTLTDQSEYNNISNAQDQADERSWGGSIYYNNATGTQTLTNVTIENGGVSVHAPSATVNLTNVNLTYATNVDWINDYGFYVASPAATVNGTPTTTWHVNSTLNNLSSVIAGVNDSTLLGTKTVLLDSDITVPSQATISQPATIDGQNHTVSVSGTGYRFLITADGTTLKNMNVVKTDKAGEQDIIGVQANNVTADGVNFTGQYAPGDNDVSRALEVSGNHTGLTVENSSFKNLRQPAYINNYASGTISNNYTEGTKGWVVEGGTNFSFTGNTWGTGNGQNAVDIAIIKGSPDTTTNNYTCTVMAQIKADNSNATIDNQLMTDPCSIPAAPSNLHIHYQGDTTNLPADANGNYVVRNTAKNIVLDWTNDTTPNVNINGVRTHVVFPDGSSTYFYQGVPYNYTNLNPRDSGQKFAANGQGKYTYTVEVKNAQGWSATSAPVVIYYVKDIPTATFKATPPRYVNGDFTITVVGNDTAVLDSVGADVRDPQDTTGNSWRANCSNPQPLNGATLPAYSDNGSGVTVEVTCTVNTASLVDGHTYTLRARAGFVEANGQSYGNVNADGNWTFTVDRDAPAAPTITAPTARQWFKSTPIVNSWTAVTKDVNGNSEHVDHYQVAYAYDDGHSFSGSTCSGATIGGVNVYCRDASSTSRNHVPASNEEGGVTIWVRAVDQAGNAGAWSQSVHYYYDHTAPTTDISVSGLNTNNAANTTFTVEGDASDNLSLNRVYVQLVRRENSQRYGGTTIDLIPNGINPSGVNAHWSQTYDIKALDLPDGTYATNVEVVDMAGNTFDPGWTANFTIDSTKPHVSGSTEPAINPTSFTITATDTTPGSGIDSIVGNVYKYDEVQGKYVLFQGHSSSTENPYTVDLSSLTGDGTYYVKYNAHDKADNTSNTEQFSFTIDHTAPVVVILSDGQNGNILQPTISVDGSTTPTGYTYSWTTDPNVTISHTDVLNPTFTVNKDGTYDFTLTVTDLANNSSTALLHFTYTTPSQPGGQGQGFTQVNGTQQPNGGTGAPATTTLADNGTGTNTPEVKGDSTTKSDVKGDNVVKFENSGSKKGNSNFLGLGWWWLLVVAVLLFIWWLIAARRSDSDKA